MSRDPYGVPTGYVPRAATAPSPADPKPDPIQQAIDDWLLMGRKARAWDALTKMFTDAWENERRDSLPICGGDLDAILAAVHPAQDASKC